MTEWGTEWRTNKFIKRLKNSLLYVQNNFIPSEFSFFFFWNEKISIWSGHWRRAFAPKNKIKKTHIDWLYKKYDH